jgi:hypothetical protein
MPEKVVTPVEPGSLPAVVLPSDGGNEAGLLAGKFKTPEELAKGYSNLATLLGKQGKLTDEQVKQVLTLVPDSPEPAAAAVVPAAVKETPEAVAAAAAAEAAKANPLQIDAAKAAASAAGLNLEDMNKEYAETGALSDASYSKLEKVGITKDIVAAFITGQEAIRVQVEQKAFAMVGGEEKYTQMLGWAETGLTPAEQKAFNDAVIGTPAAQALAISAVKARFEAAVGSDPSLVRGDASGGGLGGGYKSRAEVTADMKDPRYKKDPAYRDSVKAKLSRSGLLS